MQRSTVWTLALVLAALPAFAQQPRPLPMGAPAPGNVTDDPIEYQVAVKSAGVLTVAVQGNGDLAVQVMDEDGQVLPGGTADRDLNGNEGTELLSATLTEAGSYRVRVKLQGGSQSSFTIAGSFLPFPAFQRAGDPDRRPALAKPAQVGTALEDSLDPANGDAWDWFVIKAAQSGTLTVVTRQLGNGDAPDLVLEMFSEGTFTDPQDRSDDDMQGNEANESVSVDVKAGQTVHVRVSGNVNGLARYRLSSSLAP